MKLENEKGMIYISIASLTSAMLGLFVKLSAVNMSIPFLVLVRFLVPLFICFPVFWYLGTFKKVLHEQTIKGSHLKGHLLRAVFLILSQYCYFFYLTKSSLLNAVMLLNTAPIFIPIVSKYLFKDKTIKVVSKSIVISLIGVILVIQPDQTLFMYSSLIGLLSGVFLAFSQSIFGENVQERGMDENIFFVFWTSSIITLAVLMVFFSDHLKLGVFQLTHQTSREWLYILLIGICTTLNQYFRGVAYTHVKPHFLAPLMNLAVLFAFLFDLFVFKKTPDYLSIVGSLMIVLGTTLKWNTLRKQKKR